MINLKMCLGLLIFGCVLTMGLAGSDTVDLLQHMEHFTIRRNPFITQGNQVIDKRPEAREYIKEQFQEYGLDVQLHAFNSTGSTEVSGVNVIGISKVSSDGKVLLVGADYDTSANGDPLVNNGGGVAVMLEAARLYMENSEDDDDAYQRVGTVIFVAFDVNSLEYATFKGTPGSKYFVENWLWTYLKKNASNFEGAIILDSITNANIQNDSQIVGGDFNKAFPEAYEQIVADGSKGNFLAVISGGNDANKDLVSKFTGNYNKDRKGRMFRVQEMQMATTAPAEFVVSMLGHQAHMHFWSMQDGDWPRPLPAVLLTDTEYYRNRAAGSPPCSPTCKAEDFLTRERDAFMTKTTNALLGTLFDLRAVRKPNGEFGDGNFGTSNCPSVILTVVLLMVVKLFRVR